MEMDQIHHFLHPHPLILTHMDEQDVNAGVYCKGCAKALPGPIYGCSTCRFYLHKSCSELPREIQNFFHPCPLVLSIVRHTCNACFRRGFGFSYGCKRCDFNMHVECAQRPIIESQGEELVHHFTHWHPLALVDQSNKDLEVHCRICDKLCSGGGGSTTSSAYGCEGCNFYVHNSCMINIPRQMNHLFHPSCPLIPLICLPFFCRGCGDLDDSHLGFTCGECRFQLDFKCALLPTVESKDADKIQHSSHQHPLALRENREFGSEDQCIACEEHCSGSCYVCERCDFFLHRQCADAFEFRPKIHHPFHPLHPLSLAPLPPDSPDDATVRCAACGGFNEKTLLVYQCVECDFYLHARCAKMSFHDTTNYLVIPISRKDNEAEGKSELEEIMVETIEGDVRIGIFGEEVPVEIERDNKVIDSFEDLSVQLSGNNQVFTKSMNLQKAKREIEMDQIHHFLHPHPLILTHMDDQDVNAGVYCMGCDKALSGPIYGCSACSYELNSPADRVDSNDEFYCDVCEEKRYKFESVYYCEDCKFIAEVRCVISQLLPSLKKDQSSMKGKDEENSSLKATIAKIKNEIEELTSKEKPLEVENENLRAMLKATVGDLLPIKRRLEELRKDLSLYDYELKLNMKENKQPTDQASTSDGLASHLS
ncbi:hypothetical protein PTKIN_Ptkin04bG0214100 [Pterospermum kingtungense]